MKSAPDLDGPAPASWRLPLRAPPRRIQVRGGDPDRHSIHDPPLRRRVGRPRRAEGPRVQSQRDDAEVRDAGLAGSEDDLIKKFAKKTWHKNCVFLTRNTAIVRQKLMMH
jgi:hypothetical protein